MYVVWKRRELRGVQACEHCGCARSFVLIPLLVASRRVGGKPRQVHVARLPSIRSCCLNSKAVLNAWWGQVDQVLKRLGAAEAGDIRRKLSEGITRAGARAGSGRRRREAPPPNPGFPRHLARPLQVLGLHWPCRSDEVKAAFRARAKQTHPDAGGRAEDFRAVYEAYSYLLKNVAGPTTVVPSSLPGVPCPSGVPLRWLSWRFGQAAALTIGQVSPLGRPFFTQ